MTLVNIPATVLHISKIIKYKISPIRLRITFGFQRVFTDQKLNTQINLIVKHTIHFTLFII